MGFSFSHRWDLSPKEAIRLQYDLAEKFTARTMSLERISRIAGIDVSVKNDVSRSAVVIMSFPGLEIIETATAAEKTRFPYIPGLLSFREIPVILKCLKNIKNTPDILILDGQGRAHPRRIGIATHLGILLNMPSIGSAKSHLYGSFTEPDAGKGSYSYIEDNDGTKLGAVLRTRDRVKPVFVSPGNLMDIASSIQIILACTTRYKLPEPIRAAHNAAKL